MPVTLDDLKNCYFEAKNKLIPLTEKLRNDKKLKIDDLQTLFNNSTLWISKSNSSGHKKFKHKVSGTIVEYQAHSSSNDTIIASHIQNQILNQVQTHLNHLCNDIFEYKTNNWKYEPNYRNALTKIQAS